MAPPACTEVAIDTLTGESRVLRWTSCTTGRTINPPIDIGQIEGGFVQGMGWLTTEELVWNDKGLLTTHAPSTYKIPRRVMCPSTSRWTCGPSRTAKTTCFGSKAVGEPPFMLAISVYEAIRDAIASVGEGGPVRLRASGHGGKCVA
ncbi:molybdopterin cofactor-binding domain-containing protein [Candidatus Aalborgicola defluviihabitans]|uniref:molybdopterin cofactor-binding domain-containing protein n=1 Tax=Candidatus Aalborgicola defluviihabitans TaxID=3386187 RepID=UPI0039B98EC5